MDFVLSRNRTLANNLDETYQWLRKIAACLRYPPSQYPQIHLTDQQVAREMEALQQQFHSVHPIRRPQAILRDKLYRLWNSYGKELLHCYIIPGLPPDNLQIEGLFGRLRRHQRRITGRRSTSELREFGHYQVLFSASSPAELLDQLQRVPFSEYLIQRKKLHAAETTRRFFHRLHRDTAQTMQRLTDRYHTRSLQLDETHSPNASV